jgi:hypothetical protein
MLNWNLIFPLSATKSKIKQLKIKYSTSGGNTLKGKEKIRKERK